VILGFSHPHRDSLSILNFFPSVGLWVPYGGKWAPFSSLSPVSNF